MKQASKSCGTCKWWKHCGVSDEGKEYNTCEDCRQISEVNRNKQKQTKILCKVDKCNFWCK